MYTWICGAGLLVGPVGSLFLSEVRICPALTSQGDSVIACAVTLAFKTSTNAQILFLALKNERATICFFFLFVFLL